MFDQLLLLTDVMCVDELFQSKPFLSVSCSLEGVPIAYDDIRIVGPHGNIFDDSGYIHMDIEANFIVFHPTKGQKLVVCAAFSKLYYKREKISAMIFKIVTSD